MRVKFLTFCSCLPSCMWIRQVKESWLKACVARIQGSPEAKQYTASCLGSHSDSTSKRNYGLDLDTIVQVIDIWRHAIGMCLNGLTYLVTGASISLPWMACMGAWPNWQRGSSITISVREFWVTRFALGAFRFLPGWWVYQRLPAAQCFTTSDAKLSSRNYYSCT